MNKAYDITDHQYDVIIIGAGGSGLRATLGVAESGLRTACISKQELVLELNQRQQK